MDRFLTRPASFLAALVLTTMLVANTGCTLVATGLWVVFPNDVPAAHTGLDEQRVVVVCQPTNSLDVGNSSVATQLAKSVSRNLLDNGNDIEIVPQSEVDKWLDSNELKTPVEIGEAVGADKVVSIELGHFSLGPGSTVFQGDADAEVHVYDVATGEIEFSREPLETLYPHTQLPADSSMSESSFRRVFVNVLGDQIARTFYAYESREANKRDIYGPIH